MFKLLFEFLTEPLGLPIEWYWEYVILAVIGTFAYIIAYNCVGSMYSEGLISGRGIGSFFHWLIRLVFFVIIWAITYGIIALVKWICANWILVLCILGGIVVLAATISIITAIHKKKTKKTSVEDENERNEI